MKKKKIAVFLNSIEPLFLPKEEQRALWGIVCDKSPLHSFANMRCSFSLLPIAYKKKRPLSTVEEMIRGTNLTATLKRASITAVVVPHRSSSILVRWARANGIELLGTNDAQQRFLEDKRSFDRLLRRFDVPVPERVMPSTLSRFTNRRLVVQKSASFGGFGTRFCFGKDITAKTITSRMLVREYIHGIPAGISIFMDGGGNYFCSAIRRQCFSLANGIPDAFIGIQWIPTHTLSERTIARINEMTKALIDLLSAERFIGVANIDFIISKSGVFVLECNPRFSSATPQIIMHPDLTPHSNPWRFLLNAFCNIPNQKIHNPSLPPSTYRGALLDVDVHHSVIVPIPPPLGPRPFFLFHELPRSAHLVAGDTLCVIMHDQPLFSSRGTYTPHARSLIKKCLREFSLQP
ncbi:ATP-grasp domain-containing protein [Candidatus Uhrbacteria bacterium]|nr:ATP-grasp domain-containing protein [Candidatus Uhrbacteria bacterium]